MAKIKVGVPYIPEKEWNGKYLIISSYRPHPSDAENYQAKRMYCVHAVYEYTTVFIGRYFSLRKAREAVLSYKMTF